MPPVHFLREELSRSSRIRNQTLCISCKKRRTRASSPRLRLWNGEIVKRGKKKDEEFFSIEIVHTLYCCISKTDAALRRSAAVLATMGLAVFQSPSSMLSRIDGKTAPSFDQASGPKTTLLNCVRLGICQWLAWLLYQLNMSLAYSATNFKIQHRRLKVCHLVVVC